MQHSRTNISIAISSIALLTVLIIQVNWIIETAKIKEEIFNEKANMVLSKTAEALYADKETCKKIDDYLQTDSISTTTAKLGKAEANKVDSMFNHYMRFYNLHINYSFQIIKPNLVTAKKENAFANNYSPYQSGTYQKNLEQLAIENGLELKLLFPNKKQFIMAEMGTTFITSVVLILVVLFMFWLTAQSLLKEKKILEHTTDFLNNMTHQFKTPLTNIALAGKMIVKDSTANQPDKIKHYSSIILNENEKLKLQVEQVLSMAALERGEIPLQKTQLDFHQLIHDCLKTISIQIDNKQGHLKLNLHAQNFVLMGDKTHLTNAMCNLIDNAIKYSKEKPQLTIQTSNSNQNLVVVIADNGIGIQKEYQKKVFDKFFRVPTGDVHDVKGFGLGLTYIKKIIQLHYGTIQLESEKADVADKQNKNIADASLAQFVTTFTITLPHA